MKHWTSWLLVLSWFCGIGYCWDSEELEIFDLVEELDTNFYVLLGVPQDANATDIRKAFRRLSLLLHPDKNDAPDAEIKFRQLVAVYDVLRDTAKRVCYDRVLEHGLPDWRHAVYYYRRVRRMGLAEMAVILFVLITVGQYVVAWAAYAEKKYTAQQFVEAKLKKLQKKQKKGKYDGPTLPEYINVEIPTPRVWDTLPFQIPRLLWFTLTLCPSTVRLLRREWQEWQRRKEEEEQCSEEEEEVADLEPRGPRRRKGKFTLPEVGPSEGGSVADSPQSISEADDKTNGASLVSGGLWTDDDLAELIRLVKKFPPGTPGRWDKISGAMRRPVPEVTYMAKKVKEDGYRMGRASCNGSGEGLSEEPEVETPRKVKTRSGGRVLGEEDTSIWSQPQQRALETALTKFPKGSTLDRWDKIAKSVPGKTKEECMLRYKQLAELVKKRKVAGEGIAS